MTTQTKRRSLCETPQAVRPRVAAVLAWTLGAVAPVRSYMTHHFVMRTSSHLQLHSMALEQLLQA